MNCRWLLVRLWAAPYTLAGAVLGLAVLGLGGRAQVRHGALEFGGGWLGRMVARLPEPSSFCAVTLGHVILGVDPLTLSAVRAHEQVHVRQYERWGPLFVPAYLLSSALQFARGRRPYLDNHFEREACARAAR
jgi:hypothetical protein